MEFIFRIPYTLPDNPDAVHNHLMVINSIDADAYTVTSGGASDVLSYIRTDDPTETPQEVFVNRQSVTPTLLEAGNGFRFPTDIDYVGPNNTYVYAREHQQSFRIQIRSYSENGTRYAQINDMQKFCGNDEDGNEVWQGMWNLGEGSIGIGYDPSQQEAGYLFIYRAKVTNKQGVTTDSYCFQLRVFKAGQYISNSMTISYSMRFFENVPDNENYSPTDNLVNMAGYGDGSYPLAAPPEELDQNVINQRNSQFGFVSSDGSGLSFYEMTDGNALDLIARVYGYMNIDNSDYLAVQNSFIGVYKVPAIGTISGNTQESSIQVGTKNFQIPGYRVVNRLTYAELGYIELAGSGWDDYNDFVNTKVSLYLPFSGRYNIDANAIAGGHVTLKVVLDNYNGNITYWVYTQNKFDIYERLYGCYDGNAMISIPYGGIGNNYLPNVVSTLVNSVTGIIGGAVSQNPGNVASSVAQGALGLAMNANNYQVDKSHAVSSCANLLSPFQPRLDIERLNVIRTPFYKELKGLPIATDGHTNHFAGNDVKHFTVIPSVKFDSRDNGITEDEINDIKANLANGVYV